MRKLYFKPGRSKWFFGLLSLMLVMIITGFNYPGLKMNSENFSSPAPAIVGNGNGDEQTEVVDPKAVDGLKTALEHLAGLKHFSVDIQSTFEDLLEPGHRVDFEIASHVVVSRPDKLKSERHGGSFNQIFYYNGEVLTLYNPSDMVYATEPVPGTIEEMLHFVRDEYGINVPVSDLLYSNAFSLLMYEVDFAQVIGNEMIDDVPCTHLLFSRPGVDFQIWIATEGLPLPVKYVVTDTEASELLSFSAVMRNWNTDPELSDDLFTFSPTQEVNKIPFLKAEQSSEPK